MATTVVENWNHQEARGNCQANKSQCVQYLG